MKELDVMEVFTQSKGNYLCADNGCVPFFINKYTPKLNGIKTWLPLL